MDSRAQFEEWWETEWCGDAPMDGWQYLRGDDGYIDEGINAQWEAWQASRAAIEVELPDYNDDSDSELSCFDGEYEWGNRAGATYAVEQCANRLRNAGIGIKGDL